MQNQSKVRFHGEVSREALEKACVIYLQNKQVQKVIYEIQNNLQRR